MLRNTGSAEALISGTPCAGGSTPTPTPSPAASIARPAMVAPLIGATAGMWFSVYHASVDQIGSPSTDTGSVRRCTHRPAFNPGISSTTRRPSSDAAACRTGSTSWSTFGPPYSAVGAYVHCLTA